MRPFHKLPASSSLSGGVLMPNGASAATVVKYNLTAVANPTATDDTASGYSKGSIWINTSSNTAWICANATAGAAVWRRASSGSSLNIVGYNAVTLTNSNVTLQVGVSKNNQAFSGTLTGPVTINASRTSAIEGDELFLILDSVSVSAANTLTIQENGAGSLISWNTTETIKGIVWLLYTGSSWRIKHSNAVSS